MIVHTIDIRESGPDGLIAVLKPHDFPRAGEAEGRAVGPGYGPCYVPGCILRAWSEIVVHRLHSRRLSEYAFLCVEAHAGSPDGRDVAAPSGVEPMTKPGGVNLARLVPPKPSRRHTIAEVSYRAERIMCSCGELVTAEPDDLEHDRHEPLTVAWQEHRRGVS